MVFLIVGNKMYNVFIYRAFDECGQKDKCKILQTFDGFFCVIQLEVECPLQRKSFGISYSISFL